MDVKGPAMKYQCLYEGECVDDSVYSTDNWKTTNFQLITGINSPGTRHIIVVDCDGQDAYDRWQSIMSRNGYQPDRIWIARTGGGGWHYYFSIPRNTEGAESRQVWGLWDTEGGHPGRESRGGWCKHKEIRILGNKALVVAPPSVHPGTGNRYSFIEGFSPKTTSFPSPAPSWLLDLPAVKVRQGDDEYKINTAAREIRLEVGRYGVDLNALVDAIPHKAAIAKQWGLRITGSQPDENGWIACKAIDREDNKPSSSFNVEKGIYCDHLSGDKLGFIKLGLALGVFGNTGDAVVWLKTMTGMTG